MGPQNKSLDRRQFLTIMAVGTAALMFPQPSLSALSVLRSSSGKKFAALLDLPPGSVRPQGWLKAWLERQAENLGYHLPDVSWPFTEAYWDGLEKGDSWWPWEQTAYWVDGATRLALVLDDKRLMARVQEKIRYTVDHADPDGYLGPEFFKSPDNYHRWPQSLFFRALSACADGGADNAREIASEMAKHYLNDKCGYGIQTRNVMNVESMLWCFEQTEDKGLLELAENSWRQYMTVASDPEHGDLPPRHVFDDSSINAHGVTYAETCKQPAILYCWTGDLAYLLFAHAAQKRIFDHHMLIDGIPSTSEWFRTRTSLDSHETCDISDHSWSWGWLLQADGDGVWGDRIERAVFNAAPGALKNDWKALQYFSCPNQFLATTDSDHNVMQPGGRKMAFQPNPGQYTACCGGNVHRMLPNYVIRMWMKTPDNGLAATLYGPSVVKSEVGDRLVPIEIVQETNYPFEDSIRLTLNPDHPVEFPLLLRIPGWCNSHVVTVNGTAQSGLSVDKGFVTINRVFKKGDVVTLKFPMKSKRTVWDDGGIGLEHGPLVYSMPIPTDWQPLVEPKYTTAEYPTWIARPSGPWNFGISLSAETAGTLQPDHHPMTDNPWANPPSSISVKAKKIHGWELRKGTQHPGQFFTPPMPDLAKCTASDEDETITLVPYGCTELRLTIFPDLSEAKPK